MINISKILYKKIHNYFESIKIESKEKIKISNCKNIKFGHYQISGFKFIFNKYNINEKKILNEIINIINDIIFINEVKITNSNFINIVLKKEWIEIELNKMILSNKFNISNLLEKKNIIIDYSSPNLAKEMHIGHLRSTIIGDSSSKILEFLGNNVVRINHVGDWGINFGMIIAKIKQLEINNNFDYNKISIHKIEKLYKLSKLEYNSNLDFRKFSQKCFFDLQNGNLIYKRIWKKIIELSIENNQYLYKTLNIKLNKKNIIGESFYNKNIPFIIKDLELKNMTLNHEGSILIPLKEFKNRKGEIMSVVIQKKDKTYLYSTTELASIKYRCEFFKADRIIYYVDVRQTDHLIQSFIISKKAGYTSDNVSLEHHSFGIILNKFNKPFKTREGSTVKLIDLIKKTINNTRNFLLNNKKKRINLNKLNKLSKIIGISSLKYNDLSKNRETNYNLDLDNILSLNKNTAIYIQYSYVRILSILRKYGIKKLSNLKYLEKGKIYIYNDEEINLSLILLRFEEVLIEISKFGIPHKLCEYIYNLTLSFSKFYEKNNILNIKIKKNKISKLNLCILTARIIKQSLNFLGIKTIEKM